MARASANPSTCPETSGVCSPLGPGASSVDCFSWCLGGLHLLLQRKDGGASFLKDWDRRLAQRPPVSIPGAAGSPVPTGRPPEQTGVQVSKRNTWEEVTPMDSLRRKMWHPRQLDWPVSALGAQGQARTLLSPRVTQGKRPSVLCPRCSEAGRARTRPHRGSGCLRPTPQSSSEPSSLLVLY